MKRIGADGRSATRVPAHRAQVIETLQTSALALPVADGIIDKRKLAQSAEIRDRKNGLENTLQTGIVPFVGQEIHLQKALVGLLLHFDQIWNRDRSLNLRKVNSFAGGAFGLNLHVPLLLKAGKPERQAR